MTATENKKEKIIFRLLIVFAVLAAIKSIFTDTCYDNSYMVAMSYRHLNGDRMFIEMWEPHQTAIFFNDFLMGIYRLFVPSYTGVLLYLQICGTALLAGVAFLLYRVIKPFTGKNVATVAALFFFIFRAKQSPFPDYSNLQICFSTLVFITLYEYIKNQKRLWLLILSALFLCAAVLAYPSEIILYVPIIVYVYIKSEKRWRNVGIFTGICALCGLLYAGYFIVRVGIDRFAETVNHIIYSDTHYLGEVYGSGDYFYDWQKPVGWIMASLLTAVLIWGFGRLIKKKIDFPAVFAGAMLVIEIAMLFLQKKTGIDWSCTFYILPPVLILVGFIFGFRRLDSDEKNFYILGIIVSASTFFATCLLTDLSLLTIWPYLVLGGAVSFVPASKYKEDGIRFLTLICAIAILHRGLMVWGYDNFMVYNAGNIVRSGPSLGIVTDYMTGHMIMADEEDHKTFIHSDDRVLFLGRWIMDCMEYLLTDATISNSSVIDTPTYTEHLLQYYELYPERIPTVVAVSCWYGSYMAQPEPVVNQWLEANYEPVYYGRYWAYFRPRTE